MKIIFESPSTMSATALFLGVIFAACGAGLAADSEQVQAIRKIGGQVRPAGGAEEAWKVEFQLTGKSLTDEGLARVAALKNIVRLNLRDTKVTSSGLVHLKGLTSLNRLHLERTAVDDSGTSHLAGLVNLEYLNLYNTRITDKTLAHLAGLKKLRQLYLWQTGVTDEGVDQLEKALPSCRIVRGIDLSKIVAIPKPPPRPSEDLKWIVAGDEKPPRSVTGTGTEITFLNKRDIKVKIYWVEYGGGLRLYGELDPGGTRVQNTFSDATWLITDEKEKPLGYFRTTLKLGKAVIPKA
jgi:hypothetical protein